MLISCENPSFPKFNSYILGRRLDMIGRSYYETTGRFWPACQMCEHCNGERSTLVRSDYLRGLVCPGCDDSLDEMLEER
jgi:hypothetical protein